MKGHILGGGSFIHDGTQLFVLAIVDLDADEPKPRLCDIEFLGHGINIDPNDPTKAAVFEKKGKGACYVDLKEVRMLQRIPTAENRHFYGHGAYSNDGKLLYATESFLDRDYEGALVVRDAKTFEELGTLPTFGAAPHDCMLIDESTMIIANGGGKLDGGDRPSVTYVDVKTEKLLEKVELTQARFNAGHLAVGKSGDLALVSAPRDGLPKTSPKLGAVSLRPKGARIATMTKPSEVASRMKGETLSVAYDEARDKVIATHPEGDMLTVWSMSKTKLLRKMFSFEGPRGTCLSLDDAHYIISHRIGQSVALSRLDAETLAIDESFCINPSFTSGSHIYAHDLHGAAARA